MNARMPQVRLRAFAFPIRWRRDVLYRAIPMVRAKRQLLAEILLVLIVGGIAAWFTGRNLFHYPQYELDEGTYVGSAWTMLTQHDLFYYTYSYAHPPLGWFQIGLWSTLTGGFGEFGMSINSGRVFMLLITVVSAILIYLIVRVETRQMAVATFASVLFSVSPLSVSLHRQVYLDNIGTMWVLLSILILQIASGRFSFIVASALAFGLAFLSKEVFIVLFPGMILLIWFRSHVNQRRFAAMIWVLTAGSLISLFVLLAVLKDELLPPGTLWSSSRPHVSLITTYTHQASRGGGGLLSPHGSFWKNVGLWWTNGPILVALGAVSLLLCLLAWRKSRLSLVMFVLAASFILFLGRGGIVIYYYVIPLIALSAIAVGLIIGFGTDILRRWNVVRPMITPVILSSIIVLTAYAARRNEFNFSIDNTTSQRLAAQWTVRNLPVNSLIVMDSYAWQDLRSDSFTDGQPFPYANYYWPLFSDPDLVASLLHNNWHSIDYLLVSPNTLADARSFNLPLLQEALDHSDPVRTYSSGNWTQTIYRVRKLHTMRIPEDPILVRTLAGAQKKLLIDGRIVVDAKSQQSTSTSQANAMLQAVYANDRTMFDLLWNWASENLQTREDGLLAASWTPGAAGIGPSVASETSTEGDETAALALLFASRTWGDPSYQQDAEEILNGIWQHETVEIDSTRYVIASDQAADAPMGPTVEPGALMPQAYRIFKEADPAHPWGDLVDSSYDLMELITTSAETGASAGLVPDKVYLDPQNGEPHVTSTALMTVEGSRVMWNLTLDYLWNQDSRAKTTIHALHFFRDQLKQQDGKLYAAYNLDGSVHDGRESIGMSANVIPSLLITDDPSIDAGLAAFASVILRNLTESPAGAYWGKDEDDAVTQNQAWMCHALMNGAMANLWSGERLLEWDHILPQLQRKDAS